MPLLTYSITTNQPEPNEKFDCLPRKERPHFLLIEHEPWIDSLYTLFCTSAIYRVTGLA